MCRLLLCLVALAPAASRAAPLAVDAYLSFEGSPTGGAYYSGGTFAIRTGSECTDPTVSATGAHALRGPVSVAGVVYDGASTQSLTVNNGRKFEEVDFRASAKHDVIVFAGFITLGGTVSGYAMIDWFYIDNTQGNSWIVAPQFTSDCSGGYCVQLEGSISYGTVHGPSPKWMLPIGGNKTYWFSSKIDTPGRRVSTKIFDPDNNYAPVGEHAIETDGLGGNLILRIGRADNHGGGAGSFTYVDNIIIDWTDPPDTLLPDPGGPVLKKPGAPTNLKAFRWSQRITLALVTVAIVESSASTRPPTPRESRPFGRGFPHIRDAGGCVPSRCTRRGFARRASGAGGRMKIDSPVKTPPAPASKRSIAAKLVYGVHVPTHLSPASPVRC
ncbi:MAG: hypothetical protein HY903_06965 [Deltaproteobacteria bacterium]|nr:hypothetical protein [Deltaproteobacteria bacterium]